MSPPHLIEKAESAAVALDDLSRTVFGFFGIPIDAVDFACVVSLIRSAAKQRRPFLVSTPNVNFLISSQTEDSFRDSLLSSDLCPVDGVPIVLMARLLGIPINGRVAGSDTFELLKNDTSGQMLKVFLFGGTDQAIGIVRSLLDKSGGLQCVGTLNPGFGTVEEMSQDQIIAEINASSADLLAVFLSSQKAQGWLSRNHDSLEIPVRFNFGATINFQAGLISRAPLRMRKLGLEWLWRIKEEPYLWRRYWSDGRKLIKLFLTSVIPLIIGGLWDRARPPQDLIVIQREDATSIVVKLRGDAVAANIETAIAALRDVLAIEKKIVIDLSETSRIDQRFFGLFLMLRKQLRNRRILLEFFGVKTRTRRLFLLNGFGDLLPESGITNAAAR